MANYTKNYNLLKPLKTEKADISVINGNMDEIDLIMKSISETVSFNANHSHDSRYYTESEVDDKLSKKANITDIPHVPSKVSELENDAGYLKRNDLYYFTIVDGDLILTYEDGN